MWAPPLGSCVTLDKMPPFSEPWILIYHTGRTGTQPRLLRGRVVTATGCELGQGPTPFSSSPSSPILTMTANTSQQGKQLSISWPISNSGRLLHTQAPGAWPAPCPALVPVPGREPSA